MKLRQSRQHRRGRIEIIPMIDVMFFLLATFMLASLYSQHLDSLPINLPQGQAATMTGKHPLTLTVTGDNQLFLNKVPVALDTLAAALKPLLAGAEPNLVVAADDQAHQGIVVRAMLRARSAGVRHFLIAVKHE